MLTTVPIRGICNITLSLTLYSLFHLQPMDDLQGAAVFFFLGVVWLVLGRDGQEAREISRPALDFWQKWLGDSPTAPRVSCCFY